MLEWESECILQHLVEFHMNRHLSKLFSGFLILGLASCSAIEAVPTQPIPLAATPTLTPTILWFPPTATASPQTLATQAPTPEQKPGIGNLLFSDDFSSPASWNTASSNDATIDVSRNQLTIAVQPGIYAFSLRQNVVLTDFYAEVTVNLSLCQGQDDYGLLLRANAVAYYRFALSCDGKARVDRVSVNTRAPIQPPSLSGDAPPGAPGQVRLGVWAVGADLRFFLNGRYQFSVSDANYHIGAIGVFAHSSGSTPVTVIFSDLAVYSVNYVPPTKTPHP